ncbi:uncharacterized protein LOC134176883 [Corticium candelabrum]|uniref:uncharacterized protein LOC134176883 n=1 Tax=Corticium candelabrum TaxID=121492 RepID=UPI002E259975|nr:uncharacterized protein LOC134176883 [Corticium candelabrum]
MAAETDKGGDAASKYLELQKACLKRQTLVQRQAKTLQRNLDSQIKHYDLLKEMSTRRILQEQKRLIDSSIIVPSQELKDEAKRQLEQHTRHYKTCYVDQGSSSIRDSLSRGRKVSRDNTVLPPVEDSLRRFVVLRPSSTKKGPKTPRAFARPPRTSLRRKQGGDASSRTTGSRMSTTSSVTSEGRHRVTGNELRQQEDETRKTVMRSRRSKTVV